MAKPVKEKKITTNPDTPRRHKLFWGSSYDRGIQFILGMWPQILEKFPDAELHIFYGWNLYDAAHADNPERLAWKFKMQHDMEQKGIYHHGRVGKDELVEWMEKCGIFAYPTDFGETNCITALDCQYHGCVPAVVGYAGLNETVQSGVKVPGDIWDEDTQAEYLKQLLELMGDEKRWTEEQAKGIEWGKKNSWANIAQAWDKELAV